MGTDGGYYAKGFGGAWTSAVAEGEGGRTRTIDRTRPTGKERSTSPFQGRLPLGPPGSGKGTKDASEPTAEGFATARKREDDAKRPKPDDEVRELDLAKLEQLVAVATLGPDEDGLSDRECEAFESMHARLAASRFPLTDKQRAWVDSALERLGIEVDDPEVGGEYERKGR